MPYPCRCLWRGFVHSTRTTPARRMTLHFLQIVLIDARTFMSYLVRAVIRPRDRSSGEISTVTLSPGAMRRYRMRSAPET